MSPERIRKLLSDVENMLADGRTSYDTIIDVMVDRLRPYAKHEAAEPGRDKCGALITPRLRSLTTLAIKCAGDITGYNAAEILSKRRHKGVTTARHAAIGAVMELAPWATYTSIGACFSRDHSTVMHSRATTKERIDLQELRDEVIAAVQRTRTTPAEVA